MPLNKIETVNQIRRNLLVWTPPLVAAVVLPSHAQTSVCGSMPIIGATVPAKCAGDPLVSEALITVFSDGSDPAEIELEITSVDVVGAASTDSFTIPSLPASVTNSSGLDIEWSGNATDATTCLPISTITIQVTYVCASAPLEQAVTFSLTEILAAAI